jgi:hypothetical protein
VAWWSSRWLGASTRRAQMQVGTLWLALMLGSELAVGRARGFGWQRIGAEFDPSQGGLMLGGLLLIALAPMPGGHGCAAALDRPAMRAIRRRGIDFGVSGRMAQ